MLATWVTSPSGDVYISDLARYVKGGVLVPSANRNPVTTLAAPAAGIPSFSPAVIFEGGEDAVIEGFSLTGHHDTSVAADVQNRLTVEISDTAYRRQYMNRPILVNQVFGTPLNPFFLAESFMLENQQTMKFQLFNNSTVGNSIFSMMVEMRKFQATALTRQNVSAKIGEMRKQKSFRNPFWLTTNDPVTIPASGTTNVLFTNSRDYFLVLRYLMGQAIVPGGAAGDTQEIFTVRLFDAKTDRPLMNHPVTFNTLAGTASFPFVLPTPMLVEPVTAIRAQISSLITNQPIEVFLTFHGVGVYVANANPWEAMRVDRPAVTWPQYGAS